MRGLSSAYMKVTPAINQWLFDLVAGDDYLRQCGFIPLREVATLGFDEQYYTHPALGDNPYKKMMAALWRENPRHYMDDDESLATMASLLHIDTQGQALSARLQRWALATALVSALPAGLYDASVALLLSIRSGVYAPQNLILRFKDHISSGCSLRISVKRLHY